MTFPRTIATLFACSLLLSACGGGGAGTIEDLPEADTQEQPQPEPQPEAEAASIATPAEALVLDTLGTIADDVDITNQQVIADTQTATETSYSGTALIGGIEYEYHLHSANDELYGLISSTDDAHDIVVIDGQSIDCNQNPGHEACP